MTAEILSSALPFTRPRMVNNPTRTSLLQDTPWSRGSGSHSEFHNRHTQDDYKPYLKEDLKCNKATITFDEFLKHILCVSPEWSHQEKSTNIVNSKRYNDMLELYNSQIHHETERYHPFVELVNHAMETLRGREELVMSFCRNDPIIVKGSYAQRKPDVVGVENGVLNEDERGGVDNLSKGPAGNAFFWADLVSFLEFKVKAFMLHSGDALPAETMGRASKHAEAGSSIYPPPAPSISKTSQSRTQIRSAKRNSKATSASIERVTRASPYATRSSTKRMAPSTDPNPDILPRKRAKRSSETYNAAGSVQDDLDLQCASYALELLSHGGRRNHVIAAAITDTTIELLYYDRSIIIKSTPIDFVSDDSCFIAMLKCFAKLTPSQWGYEPLVKHPHISRRPPLGTVLSISLHILQGQTITLCNGNVLELGTTVYHQHGLIGRGTWVVRAKLQTANEQTQSSDSDDAWDRGLIVKLSWSPKSRKSEDIIVNEARSYAKDCGDLWVLDHLPNVLHAQDIDRTTEEPVKGLIELLGDGYEPRVLWILVLEELFPITDLATAPVLADAFRGIFNCYEWLYTKPGIFHRDISVNNMMYRKKDGKVFGVLNDYDLAIFKSNNAPSSKTRTGTKPFMAIDLLGNPTDVHRYRHDLESMFYVIVYVTSRYHEGQELDDPPLQCWEELGEVALKAEKALFITGALPLSSRLFENFDVWTDKMREALLQGRASYARHLGKLRRAERLAGSIPVFDLETLDGHVSFKVFGDIFDLAVE